MRSSKALSDIDLSMAGQSSLRPVLYGQRTLFNHEPTITRPLLDNRLLFVPPASKGTVSKQSWIGSQL
jgi:hypothetical protein